MCARCILSTIPRMRRVHIQYTHAHAHSFAIHRLSPLPERGAPPRVVICRACNDREGRDSLEAVWDMPFLIRSRCKPERSCSPSSPQRFSSFSYFLIVFPSCSRILKPLGIRLQSIDCNRPLYLSFCNLKIWSELLISSGELIDKRLKPFYLNTDDYKSQLSVNL